MSIKPNFYPDEYYGERLKNQPDKRTESFVLESKFIKKYIKAGILMDVGCATGEFLDVLDWDGEKYGMEISEHAIKIAEKKGIRFDKDLSAENFFDLIIFRGTIQHVDTPIFYIKQAFRALKPGGYIVFLATPNADSIYYRLFKTLPFLSPTRNFYIPSETTLQQILTNFGFEIIEKRFPYLNSPYSNPIKDHVKFILRCLGFNTKFPFWKSSMELIAQKPRA
jgi:2-polyprenyl-3-methyl-5-hydroxy-6-metoxy-1,4-benzoquinol methylase